MTKETAALGVLLSTPVEKPKRLNGRIWEAPYPEVMNDQRNKKDWATGEMAVLRTNGGIVFGGTEAECRYLNHRAFNGLGTISH